MSDSTPKSLFEERLKPGIAANADRAKEIGATFVFKLSGDNGGDWTVDMSAAEVSEGAADEPEVAVSMSDTDFVDLVEGRLQGMTAFMEGKIQIDGDMGLALQLQELLDMQD